MIKPEETTYQIYVHVKPVDFRKQVNGLSNIVQCILNHNPMSGDLFVFFNRALDKVRILFWERTGFVLYSKYLEEDNFVLPKTDDQSMCITSEQLRWLLEGININLMKPHKPRRYDLAG